MGQWAFSMENVLGLNLPWRSLSSHLVTTDKDGNIDYMSGFQDVHIQKPVKEVSEIAPVKTWLALNILWTTYEFLSSLKSWEWNWLVDGHGSLRKTAKGGCSRYVVICSGNLCVVRIAKMRRDEKVSASKSLSNM